MAKTTADVLFERLIEWGVDAIFGLPGDGINGFMEALRTHQDRIRFIQVRHEEGAAFAACGYAKYSGRLGVCIATSGPGAIHLLNGLYDAKMDGAPVLAITGQTYHDLMGMRYQQEVNLLQLFADVAVFNQQVMGPHARTRTGRRRLPHGAVGQRGRAHQLLQRLAGDVILERRAFGREHQGAHVPGLDAADRRPASRVTQERRGPAQRRQEDRDPRRPGRAGGRGRARAGRRHPGRADRQGPAGQGGRPRRFSVHDRRDRPAGHAPLRAGDGGVRHAS